MVFKEIPEYYRDMCPCSTMLIEAIKELVDGGYLGKEEAIIKLIEDDYLEVYQVGYDAGKEEVDVSTSA